MNYEAFYNFYTIWSNTKNENERISVYKWQYSQEKYKANTNFLTPPLNYGLKNNFSINPI